MPNPLPDRDRLAFPDPFAYVFAVTVLDRLAIIEPEPFSVAIAKSVA